MCKKPASDSAAEETDAAPVQPLDPRHHGRLSWAFLGPGWALSRSWSPVFFPNDESEIMNDEMTNVSDFIFPYSSFIVEVMRGQVNDFANSVNGKSPKSA